MMRALIPIYLTNFVDALGYSMLIPLLPLVAERFGVATVVVGTLLGTPAFIAITTAPIWGRASDRLGRKPMIVTAEALSCIGNVVLALSNSLPLFFASRAITGLGMGGGGALDEAFIADVTTDAERNRAYAIYGLVYGLAFVIGPAVSAALSHGAIGSPFWIAAGLSFVNVFLSQWLLKPQPRAARTSILSSIAAIRSPNVRKLIAAHFLFIFAVACFLTNFALYFERVMPRMHENAGWFLSSAGIIGGATIVFLEGRLAKIMGERHAALSGLAVSAVGYLLLIVVRDPVLFGLCVSLWAMGAATVQPTLTALLSRKADRREIGAVLGVTDSMYSLAMIAGPIAGSAVLGANPRLFGLLPAAAAAVAFAAVRATD